jgi:hypothetical protein
MLNLATGFRRSQAIEISPVVGVRRKELCYEQGRDRGSVRFNSARGGKEYIGRWHFGALSRKAPINSGGTTMKRRNPLLRGLSVIMLLCSLLSPTLAQAQFTQQGPKLVATDAIGDPRLGASVSLSGDGNTAIVGGYGDNDFSGAVWVYTRNRRAEKGKDHSAASGGVWSQRAKLVGTGAIGPSANQGYSVSLSADGNTAIVGGYNDNYLAGAAWVYTRNRPSEKGEEDHPVASDGMWSQQAKLVGTGA